MCSATFTTFWREPYCISASQPEFISKQRVGGHIKIHVVSLYISHYRRIQTVASVQLHPFLCVRRVVSGMSHVIIVKYLIAGLQT